MRSGNYLAIKQPTYTDGTLNCSTNPDFPAGTAGMRILITHSGKVGGANGLSVAESDFIVCLTGTAPTGDYATVGSHWNLVMPEMDMSNLRVVDLFVADSATFGDSATFTSAVTFNDTATLNGELVVKNTSTFYNQIGIGITTPSKSYMIAYLHVLGTGSNIGGRTAILLENTKADGAEGVYLKNSKGSYGSLQYSSPSYVAGEVLGLTTDDANISILCGGTNNLNFLCADFVINCSNLIIGGNTGWTGTFLNGESSTVTVTKGIITGVA